MAPSDPTGCRRWRGDGSTRSLHSPRGTPCRWCRGLRDVCSKTKQVPKQNGFGRVLGSLFIPQTESWLRGTYTWALRSVLLCNSPWSRSEKSCRTQAGTRSALGRGHVPGEQWLCDGCSTGLEQRGAPAARLGDRLSSRARVKRDHLQECVWLETTTLPEKFLCSRGCCLAVWQKGAVSNNATKQRALQLPLCLQDRCELFVLGPGRWGCCPETLTQVVPYTGGSEAN